MQAFIIRHFPVLLLAGLGIYCGVLSMGEKEQRPAPKLAVQQMGESLESCLSHYKGHPVVLLVTARWSPGLGLIEQKLNAPEVAAACLPFNAVVVVADMTSRRQELQELTARQHQAGVPYMLVYAADRSRPPVEVAGIFGDEAALARAIQSALALLEP